MALHLQGAPARRALRGFIRPRFPEGQGEAVPALLRPLFRDQTARGGGAVLLLRYWRRVTNWQYTHTI